MTKPTELGAIAELVVRIDERTKLMDEKIDCVNLVILGNGKPETGLAARFSQHVEAPHLHKLARSKMFWAIMFAVMLIANLLVDLGSPVITLVGRLLGVPIS